MRLERDTGHQTPARDDTSQSSSNHLCLRETVIGTRCHHIATQKEAGQPSAERRSVPRPSSNQGTDYSGVLQPVEFGRILSNLGDSSVNPYNRPAGFPSVFLGCLGHGRAAVARGDVRPRRRSSPPFLQPRTPETCRRAERAHDAVAPPASIDLAKEAARQRHRSPSATQTQWQPAREAQSVRVSGPMSRCAFPKPANSVPDVLKRREQKFQSGGEHPLPVDGEVKA
jgi:hypothetical protein